MIAVFISTLALYVGALGAARYLHNDLLRKVLRAPIPTFFDVTPVGRIINRFSHDVDAVDNDLPATLRAWCSCFFGVYTMNSWKRGFWWFLQYSSLWILVFSLVERYRSVSQMSDYNFSISPLYFNSSRFLVLGFLESIDWRWIGML